MDNTNNSNANAGSTHRRSRTTESNTETKNPFDIDVDFTQLEARRNNRAKSKVPEPEQQPILPQVDAEPIRKPPVVAQRAKTTGTDVKRLFGFGSSDVSNNINAAMSNELSPTKFTVGSRTFLSWPYDDYHVVQKLYYEQLEQNGSTEETADNTRTPEHSTIPVFSRPDDPVDIPTAVQGLPLTHFTAKAEERAIAIVSTWLFDAGLIDELLVHGASTNDDKSTSEGVEVGPLGNVMDQHKLDKEIAKLKSSTKRQLALVNARLNEGVAATGSEVQELVQAVMLTKQDIGRLRELSTYVSNTESVQYANYVMLTKYPKLKQAVNARRNLARCFRELDFFATIPATCDRLREELHAGEWTAHEWSSLRSVCREHVELELFLVEAEAGMKKRSKQDDTKFGWSKVGLSTRKEELIDRFLEEHVENVWELGDEIRLRIMSGIASSFDLAMNNPAGMVALVEAVEVYETANEEYKSVHGEEAGLSQSLRFTDMRAAALGEVYKVFETRGLDVFRELTEQAADIARDEDANAKFSAVLRAANELASEIGIMKEQMAPCFPPSWSIETLWTTCVAHVCSNNILQQIGGPEGHRLPDLTVTQLLDLVAWVENFREIIEETFPNIREINSSRTYLDKPPKLLMDNNKAVDIEVAKDSLAWVNKVLWEVHDLAKDEFLFRTKEQTEDWLNNVYEAEHTKNQTAEGRLVTSLCEDVYSLAGVQLRTIRERLTRRSEALVQAVGVIFKNLYEKQIACRDRFCTDLETCCAASNDFIRMSEKCEEMINEIQEECNLSREASETLAEQSAALLGLYSGDAVYAAQTTHIYCFEPIEEAIGIELFREEWEVELTQNELALTVVRTLDDFMEDLETFLDEVMLLKTVEAQISAAVNFYLKCMLARSSEHSSSRNSFFVNTERAIARMRGDILTMREYFDGLSENMPTLTRTIEREFSFLDNVLEVLSIAAGLSKSDARDFILILQKRIRNIQITKYLVGDLYHLVKPADERAIYELMDSMESEMSAVAPTDEKASTIAQDRNTVPGLRLDHMLATHCDGSKRKRPLQAGNMERAEAAFLKWRTAVRQHQAEET